MRMALTHTQRRAIAAAVDAETIASDTLAFVEVTSETGAEGEGSAFLADLLRREGFDVEEDAFLDGRPNVYARVAGAGE